MTSPTENTKELSGLPMNKIEAIVADHDKAMREDMASEIVGGSRSKAITDVITVKAIAALITSSNHQAVQAFGEKVLKEVKAIHTRHDCECELVVPVSVITSLMKDKA